MVWSLKQHLGYGVLLTALLAAGGINATPIDTNAVTPVGTTMKLNDACPVKGNGRTAHMVKPIVVKAEPTLSRNEVAAGLASENATNTTTPANDVAHRLLEAESPDLTRLEAFFGEPMVTNLDTLMTHYRGYEVKPMPWPSSYWPTYEDSINHRWRGDEPSPAEKYAKAFNLNVKDFMNSVSSILGVDSMSDGTPCTSGDQCNGDACGIREGQSSGYCIPGWWGICHAWAPASILEDEPQCDVEVNGVTFHPFDIKALVSAVYDDADVDVIFTGARYDGGDNPVDEYGRYTDPMERDLGAGFFHIAVSNIMGKFHRSFVIDADAQSPVWNQPVRSYQIAELEILSPAVAAKSYFNVDAYPFNNNAFKVAYVHMVFQYMLESYDDGPLVSSGAADAYATKTVDYYYLLELDQANNILGGEWLWGSMGDHPDFLWFAVGKPKIDRVTNTGLKYKDVTDLIKKATTECGTTPSPSPTPSTSPSPTPSTSPSSSPSPTPTSPPDNSQNGDQTTDKCDKPEHGVDYYGEDLFSVYGISHAECCDKCASTGGCKAYSYVASWQGCYLKTGTGDKRKDAKVVSATVAKPLPIVDNGKCSTPEHGIDYYGDDLFSVSGISHSECCDKCASTGGCKAYSYVPSTATCYLKSGMGDRRKDGGVVSAKVSDPIQSGCSTPVWGVCGNAASGASCCPAGQYCQPWDVNYYQCINLPSKCPEQQTNVDFYGDDLSTSYGIGPGECCELCSQTKGCKAITYVNDNPGTPACYLKKGTGQRRSHKTAVSAVLA